MIESRMPSVYGRDGGTGDSLDRAVARKARKRKMDLIMTVINCFVVI